MKLSTDKRRRLKAILMVVELPEPNCTDAMPYKDACNLVRAAGIKGFREFNAWNRPEGMPSAPYVTYAGAGWKSWKDFLGTEFMNYKTACKTVRAAGIKGFREFKAWTRPHSMPSNPDRTYAGAGWKNWKEFLGKPKAWQGSNHLHGY